MPEYKLSDIARLIEAELVGDGNAVISNIAKIEEAQQGDLSFIANPKYLKYADSTNASALIVEKSFATSRSDISLLKVENPYFAFLKIMEKIQTPKDQKPLTGLHPASVIHPSVQIGENVYIGPNAVICENCKIGNNSIIHAGVYVGEDSSVGNSTVIYPNAVLREKTKIGNRVIIHPGAVLGADGFGFVPTKEGKYIKLPQLGGVVVEDDVEIGANTTIDRATIGNTVIKSGTKLDNLIMLAHNVVIGENTVIAAQTGIAGSTKLGKNCVIAGQVGVVGHIEIADKVSVGAQSGISKSVKKEGTALFGSPAIEYRDSLRNESAVRQLPQLLVEFRELKQKISDLEKQITETK